jgi:hypothetical protein
LWTAGMGIAQSLITHEVICDTVTNSCAEGR